MNFSRGDIKVAETNGYNRICLLNMQTYLSNRFFFDIKYQTLRLNSSTNMPTAYLCMRCYMRRARHLGSSPPNTRTFTAEATEYRSPRPGPLNHKDPEVYIPASALLHYPTNAPPTSEQLRNA